MATRTLAIPDWRRCKSTIHSLVRLAKKSYEMNLRMDLPSPLKVSKMMQSYAVPETVARKFSKLPEEIRNLPHFRGLSVDGPLDPWHEDQKTEYYCFKLGGEQEREQ